MWLSTGMQTLLDICKIHRNTRNMKEKGQRTNALFIFFIFSCSLLLYILLTNSKVILKRFVIDFCVSFSNRSSLYSIPFFKSQFDFLGARLISSFRYSLVYRKVNHYIRHIRRFFHRCLIIQGRFVDDNRIHSLLQICISGHIITESNAIL